MSGPWWMFALLGAGIVIISIGGDRLLRRLWARDIEGLNDRDLLDQETQRYYDEQERGR